RSAADQTTPASAPQKSSSPKPPAWSPHPSPCPDLPTAPSPRELLFHELATTLVERTECLLRGDRRADLVVIPGVLGLGRLLDLDEIRGMNLAPVRANGPLAEERIVGRHLLHLGDDLGAVVALERLDGFQVVQGPRVDARVDHRRMNLPVALGEALGEGTRLVVHVPVEGLGEGQPLGLLAP